MLRGFFHRVVADAQRGVTTQRDHAATAQQGDSAPSRTPPSVDASTKRRESPLPASESASPKMPSDAAGSAAHVIRRTADRSLPTPPITAINSRLNNAPMPESALADRHTGEYAPTAGPTTANPARGLRSRLPSSYEPSMARQANEVTVDVGMAGPPGSRPPYEPATVDQSGAMDQRTSAIPLAAFGNPVAEPSTEADLSHGGAISWPAAREHAEPPGGVATVPSSPPVEPTRAAFMTTTTAATGLAPRPQLTVSTADRDSIQMNVGPEAPTSVYTAALSSEPPLARAEPAFELHIGTIEVIVPQEPPRPPRTTSAVPRGSSQLSRAYLRRL